MAKETLYYIQNAGYCGNYLFWWKEGRRGYVTDIRKAGKYTEGEARKICMRAEDTAWPVEYIDNLFDAQKLVIDCQLIDHEFSINKF